MIGLTAPDAIRHVALHDLALPESYSFEFVMHEVGVNWRQRNATVREKIASLGDCLPDESYDPFLLRIGDRAAMARAIEAAERQDLALSVTSRIWDDRSAFAGHLAVMNLHPDGFADVRELGAVVFRVAGGIPGYLLATGRYAHFYGARLLSREEWLGFVTRFLMPCVLVSPRYVGHSVARGFCCVRLNAVRPHKPVVPRVGALVR